MEEYKNILINTQNNSYKIKLFDVYTYKYRIVYSKLIKNEIHIIYYIEKDNMENDDIYFIKDYIYLSFDINNYTINNYLCIKSCDCMSFILNDVYYIKEKILYKYCLKNNEIIEITKINDVYSFNNVIYIFNYKDDILCIYNSKYSDNIIIYNISKKEYIPYYNNKLKSLIFNIDNKLYIISNDIFIYDFENKKDQLINNFNGILNLGKLNFIEHINNFIILDEYHIFIFIDDFSGLLYNVKTSDKLKVNSDNEFKIYNNKFKIINNKYYIDRNNLHIMYKNNLSSNYNILTDNVILKSSISEKYENIPKDILIYRCGFFKEMNEIYELKNEFINEIFENIDIYVEFVKNGNINNDNIEKLLDICLYLQDIDIDYVLYYYIKNYNDINKTLLKLFNLGIFEFFYLLLNNYLDNLKIHEYKKFINECDVCLTPYILNYNSKNFIRQ